VLIRDVEVEGTVLDVRLRDGRVRAVGEALPPERGDEILEGAGGALLPGLHDHHVHLRAAAANAGSILVGPPEVTDSAGLGARLRQAALARPDGAWIRAVGYHESVAGDLDRHVLDAIVPRHPVRVQHRTGIEWTLNSAAIDAFRIETWSEAGVDRDHDGVPTGRLRRLDARLGTLTRATSHLDFAAVSRRAAATGITGFTDADPERTPADLTALVLELDDGRLLQSVHVMGPVALTVPSHERLTLGPVKAILDDDALPTVDELAALVGLAHAEQRRFAVHCVTRVQLVVALAAFSSAGTVRGDRIEHAAVVAPELIEEIARLGLTVVTQPGFVAARGDQYLSDVEPDELPDLYRCGSLLAAGVPIAFGTDAPYGPTDPWAVMRAAADRRTGSGAVLGDQERIRSGAALARFLGVASNPSRRRRIEVGAAADLCLLRAPLDEALIRPSEDFVVATIIGGELAYSDAT
jgi:predicted amidohydrolase YtcJ